MRSYSYTLRSPHFFLFFSVAYPPHTFFIFLCSLRERSEPYISRNEYDIDISIILFSFYNLSYLHFYFICSRGLLKIHFLQHTCIMSSLCSLRISTFFYFLCIITPIHFFIFSVSSHPYTFLFSL